MFTQNLRFWAEVKQGREDIPSHQEEKRDLRDVRYCPLSLASPWNPTDYELDSWMEEISTSQQLAWPPPRSRYHQETCMTAQPSGLTHWEAKKWSKGVQSPAPTCSVTFCTWLVKGRDGLPAAPPTPAGQADSSGLALLGMLTQCSFANYKI